MANEEIASQVLDYWFAIEFLGQDSYDVCTEESKLVRALKTFKKADQSTKNKRRQISVFELVNSESDIYSQIVNQAKECDMTIWGNLTFYIGRVSRQACIEKLAQELGAKLEQEERNSEYIPILSFQCTTNGAYVEHSLSLSTVIWAISQVEGKQNGKLSDLLSSRAYSDTIEQLEREFFESDNFNEQEAIEEASVKVNSEGMPVFADDAIVASKIMSIHSEIVKMYGKFFPENVIEERNGFKYQLFKNSKAKDKYDDDNYMGLSHDFFSNDLKMVKESIEAGKDDFSTGMLSNLIDYICAPHDVLEERQRHDFVRPKDKEVFYKEIAEILNMENAPLGKWPSRYMPALMQQIAINIAISNRQRGIFEESGNVFSVNGPPGTGKTTLLKEIIANNIVEKARALSQYDTPDDAFEGVKFVCGELNGAYAQYYPKWFRFKDEHIADFGVLVTSSNNTAVENITKELPLEKGILDNLKIVSDGNMPDSPEKAQQLRTICKMFSTSETEKKLNVYQKDTKRQGEYPEIYFTGYAKKFFGNAEKDADAWGMVAAPLGKKSNISGFYYDVLNPILQDFMIKNADIEDRIPEYRKARDAFSKQLEVVSSLQSQLKSYGDISLKAHQLCASFEQIRAKNISLIICCDEEIKSFENQIVYTNTEIKKEEDNLSNFTTLYSEADFKLKESEKRMKDLSEQEISYKKQALDVENSVGFFTKIFRKSKYQSALDLAECFRLKAQECTIAVNQASHKIGVERAQVEKYRIDKDNALQRLHESKERLKKLEGNKSTTQMRILRLKGEINNAQVRAEAAKSECERDLREYLSAGDMKTGKVLDDTFIEDVLSKNDKVSTKAQISNPWSTEEFNREREKLFYLALQMTKEFVLSSKSCRTNLCILGQYWGFRTENDTDRIKFHKQDREAMIASLFQTLFLITPVISSTFASVGRLLRDMKTPGCIGTLVIDEAGQAQPQMAVGALYRARKAIIVGDPKQVEPVVTDDLKLLKEAYSEPVFANYKNKSLSVQSCADIMNPFGTSYDNGTDYPDWVGCPLLVHRRCICPMYEISNRISYNGIMKQQTLPPSDGKVESFIYEKSQWINVTGVENGHGDHYVAEQGNVVCEMVNVSFQKAIKISKIQVDTKPSLYIITPFTTVVSGLRKAIGTYATRNKNSALGVSTSLDEWLYDNIGTVHKFQGKEANEVIFVLGCDESQKNRYAVKGFVNSNIVNVAATRAKYRFYMVGDQKVWGKNEYVNEAKSIMDRLLIEDAEENN